MIKEVCPTCKGEKHNPEKPQYACPRCAGAGYLCWYKAKPPE